MHCNCCSAHVEGRGAWEGIHIEPNLLPSSIRGKVDVKCLKVHFGFRFSCRACLLSSVLHKGPHHRAVCLGDKVLH